jgi:hypothetical protein
MGGTCPRAGVGLRVDEASDVSPQRPHGPPGLKRTQGRLGRFDGERRGLRTRSWALFAPTFAFAPPPGLPAAGVERRWWLGSAAGVAGEDERCLVLEVGWVAPEEGDRPADLPNPDEPSDEGPP